MRGMQDNKRRGQVVVVGALLALALIVLAGRTVSPASAAPEATLLIESATVNVGETAEVDIVANVLGEPVGGRTFDPTWDSSVVTATRCTAYENSVCSAAFSTNSGRVTGASATGLSGEATLATFEFLCQRIGTSAVTLEVEIFGSGIPEDSPIRLEVINAEITYVETLPRPPVLPRTGSATRGSQPFWPLAVLAAFGVATASAAVAARSRA